MVAPANIDWIQPYVPPNFVSPGPKTDITVPGGIDLNLPQSASSDANTSGSHIDRASAWLRYTMPISVSLAVCIVAVLLMFDQVRDASALIVAFRIFGIFFGAFATCYFLMFRYYMKMTPEYTSLRNVERMWNWVDREQHFRQVITSEKLGIKYFDDK